MKSRITIRTITFLVFAVSFTVHFLGNVVPSSDSRWVVPTALSMEREHNANIDEYRDLVHKWNYYAVDSSKGHLYCEFPPGTAFISLPFVYLVDVLSYRILNIDLLQLEKADPPRRIELFIASAIVAICTVLIYFLAKEMLLTEWQALLVTFIFSFCTSALSTASRSLWQHGPSMLMLAIVLILLIKARKKPSVIRWAGIPLAYSYLIRPTNAISIFFISILVFLEYRKYFIQFLLGASAIAAIFIYYNYSVYGQLFSPYYLGRNQGYSNLLIAMTGNLFSPARGLFIFSPILLFAIFGMFLRIRHKKNLRQDWFIIVIIFIHWISISSIRSWWGGWSFGPRYFTDMLPYLIYFLITFISWLTTQSQRIRGWLFGLVVAFSLLSFYINFRGAYVQATWDWNFNPANIDEHPERLWSWSDLQFLR